MKSARLGRPPAGVPDRRRSNLAGVKVYTRKGDDGTTGLLYGGRVAKDDSGPEAYGTTDEAVAALGVARAIAAESAPDLAGRLLDLQRQLFVVGAELATAPENRHKLELGVTLVSAEMVKPLEVAIDAIEAERGMPTEFVVPGQNHLAAALDVARTVVRRAERRAVGHEALHGIEGSQVVPYLNRLADYLWMAARGVEPQWESSTADRHE
jgi:cob(I)alamin adenosyltransferase